ncbi:MAG: PAS domain S-box protein [Desulforegulaceae bacterium]|nr:PAS domain S-box protein [Desulforegulaceae bacterium]
MNNLNSTHEQLIKKIKSLEAKLEIFTDSIESLEHFLMITDNKGTIEYVNPAFLKFTGFTEKEVIGKKTSILKSGKMSSDYYARLWKALSQGKTWKEEITNKKKNNELYHAFQIISPIKDDNGNIENFVAIQNDITEQKEAEKKLKEILNEYDSIFNNTIDAIFLIKVENEQIFRFIKLNPAHEKLTGLLTQNIKGKTPFEILGKDISEQVEKNYRTCLRKKAPIDYEETLDLPGGKRIWHTRLSPVIDNDKVEQIIGVAREVTNERKLTKERDMFFEVSLDMICIATFDGYFKQLSPMWEKVLGWSDEELKARPYLELIHPDDIESTLEASKKLEFGEKIISFDNRYLKKDGSYNWLSWKSFPDPEDRLIYAIARDIQERKEMEQKLLLLSQTDSMLKIFNRGKLLAELRSEIKKFKRYNSNLSVIMLDIDHFKGINDNFGHDAGDMVLKKLTSLVQEEIRDTDVFARWGGEEFIVLLPNTPINGGTEFAERLRKKIEQTDFKNPQTVTVSLGVTVFKTNDTEDSFLKRVDNGLYLAKKNGRNRVETVYE